MKNSGFTLAELLIALGILGIIATFTIPKVLNGQRSAQWTSLAKEQASAISGAYQAYLLNNTLTTTMRTTDLTPYLNYVDVDTISRVDESYGSTFADCAGNPGRLCLRLHSGSVLYFSRDRTFDGLTPDNAIYFKFDPDGKYSGSATGDGKAISFYLYTNGRLTTRRFIDAGTPVGLGQTHNPYANGDALWFSWD